MRDIPKINYNTSTKTKKIVTENEAGGTLTKCNFRTYKDFLEHYDGNKNNKDDQESVSSVDSGISESTSYSTSTSSLNSETNGPTPKAEVFSNGRTGSFRKYLETYNNKKFSSVKPNVVNKQNVIKSEIVIQVNTLADADLEDVPDFPPPPPPVEEFDVVPTQQVLPPPPPIPVFDEEFVPPPPPPMLANIPPPPPPMMFNVNNIAKKWGPIQTESNISPTKEKTNNRASSNFAAVLTQNALFKRKAHESENKTETVTDFRVSNASETIQKLPKPSQPKHTVKPFVNHRTITIEVPLSSPPKVLNDVEYDTTTVVPISDKSTKVNTNDPNIKKMVYSTYRGLLGAYNNKANDMIATLPRTMVREDRGIAKQLESIVLQGGFEKLNGRTNPKVEKE
ncbi:hypothetical protein FQA39_LY17334 [Lamprigera yunnana]|nr:hypothetical protein FQA39_LY17334 [Lamprigera yunnana]